MEERDKEERRLSNLTIEAIENAPFLKPGQEIRQAPGDHNQLAGNVPKAKKPISGKIQRFTIAAPCQTVFDARPLNGRDWYLPVDLVNSSVGVSVADVYASIDFPGGYIGLLRKFSVQLTHNSSNFPVYMSATDNQGSKPQVVFGVSQGASIFQLDPSTVSAVTGTVGPQSESTRDQQIDRDTYIIIPENGMLFFGVKKLPLNCLGVRFEMYGNLLLSRGRSTNMEALT